MAKNSEEIPDQKLDRFFTVSEAADFLGVSASTLRNWDRQGKLRAHRHPINRYRLYRREKLEQLLAQIRPDETLRDD